MKFLKKPFLYIKNLLKTDKPVNKSPDYAFPNHVNCRSHPPLYPKNEYITDTDTDFEEVES